MPCEVALDDLARQLNMDPLDLRMVNAADEGTEAPYGPKFPAIGFKACIEAAKKHPNYNAPVPEGAGRGVAAGFWFNVGMQSSAEVRLNEDGTVIVMEGNPDIGGSRASMSLMAAETLGVPYEQVKTYVGDTESTGFCNLTGGSRTTFATGMAVVRACEDVIAQCKSRAAATWGMDEEQVEWRDGQAVPAPGVNADVNPLSLADLAAGAPRTGGPILGRASLNAQGAGASFSVNFADLRVDGETGAVEVLSFTAVQDAGKAIHPAYVEGQMQGGAAQGLGWALNEEYIYDAEGVMENPGFLDYRVPVASDLPMIDTEIVEVPNPSHPYVCAALAKRPSWRRWRWRPMRCATPSAFASTTCRCRRRASSPRWTVHESSPSRHCRNPAPGAPPRAAAQALGLAWRLPAVEIQLCRMAGGLEQQAAQAAGMGLADAGLPAGDAKGDPDGPVVRWGNEKRKGVALAIIKIQHLLAPTINF